ncbi:unnamed protein product [Boreogadus saida]
MALSFLYPLCVWFCVICTSMETGFIYQYPAVGLQRVTAQQRAVPVPPGATQNQYRNWCQYTVSRTVSCQVHNGTETTVQRVFQGCRWPGPCPKLISYRTLVRPAYKVAYRQVTALEWRNTLNSSCQPPPEEERLSDESQRRSAPLSLIRG